MENAKVELSKKYKPIKIYAYLTIGSWAIGIILAMVGLILTIIPGIGMDVIDIKNPDGTDTKSQQINTTGIILLSVMGGVGIIIAILSQTLFPYFMKKHLIKTQDKNYDIIINYIRRCHSSPFSGSMVLLKQIDWIINYKQENDKQIQEISDFIEKNQQTRLQKEKSEQEKLDQLYTKEATELKNKDLTIIDANNDSDESSTNKEAKTSTTKQEVKSKTNKSTNKKSISKDKTSKKSKANK